MNKPSRAGLAKDFYQASKVTHVLVEASIDATGPALIEALQAIQPAKNPRWRLDRDIWGQSTDSDADFPPLVLFQLIGQGWTQIFADIRFINELRLGRELSSRLDTRCFSVGVTDDEYGSHALFHAGEPKELSLSANLIDMNRILHAVGLKVPRQFRDVDTFDDSSHGRTDYSWASDGGTPPTLSEHAGELGVYFHSTFWETGSELAIHGLEPGEVVRLDGVHLEPETSVRGRGQSPVKASGRPPSFAELLEALESRDLRRLEELAAHPGAMVITSRELMDECLPIFHLAARRGDLEAIRVLVRAGADVDGAGVTTVMTPLFEALLNGHPEAVELLLDAGANPDRSCLGLPPILAALTEHDLRSFRALVAAGADLSATDRDGRDVKQTATDPLMPEALRKEVEAAIGRGSAGE